MKNTLSSCVKKWTTSTPSVHFLASLNGQVEKPQVFDFPEKTPCPSKLNSGGPSEGTLPGKA
jgi:hypothetical protein